MLLHAPIFSYAWTLEVLANSAWNVGVTQRFIDYETRRMYIRSNHPIESGLVWYDWVEVAQCIAPEVHELPLADSINRLGTAAYWKNAFNEVTVVFDYGEKSNDNFAPDQWTLIATLPEGFRPVLQSQWGMCSDSGSDNVVATYRLDYDGSLYYRASTAAVNKKSLGGIRFVFIARN